MKEEEEEAGGAVGIGAGCQLRGWQPMVSGCGQRGGGGAGRTAGTAELRARNSGPGAPRRGVWACPLQTVRGYSACREQPWDEGPWAGQKRASSFPPVERPCLLFIVADPDPTGQGRGDQSPGGPRNSPALCDLPLPRGSRSHHRTVSESETAVLYREGKFIKAL